MYIVSYRALLACIHYRIVRIILSSVVTADPRANFHRHFCVGVRIVVFSSLKLRCCGLATSNRSSGRLGIVETLRTICMYSGCNTVRLASGVDIG